MLYVSVVASTAPLERVGQRAPGHNHGLEIEIVGEEPAVQRVTSPPCVVGLHHAAALLCREVVVGKAHHEEQRGEGVPNHVGRGHFEASSSQVVMQAFDGVPAWGREPSLCPIVSASQAQAASLEPIAR